MQVPASFYGPYKEVKARSRKIVTRLFKGASFNEALSVEEVIDSSSTPGLFALHGPSPLLTGEPHFHFYTLLLQIKEALFKKRLPSATEERVFADSLETAWGVLGLLSPPNVMWVSPAERHRPLLAACLQFWEQLSEVGERYSVGLNRGQNLRDLPTNIQYVLVNLGVPPNTLRATPSETELLNLIGLYAQETIY